MLCRNAARESLCRCRSSQPLLSLLHPYTSRLQHVLGAYTQPPAINMAVRLLLRWDTSLLKQSGGAKSGPNLACMGASHTEVHHLSYCYHGTFRTNT